MLIKMLQNLLKKRREDYQKGYQWAKAHLPKLQFRVYDMLEEGHTDKVTVIADYGVKTEGNLELQSNSSAYVRGARDACRKHLKADDPQGRDINFGMISLDRAPRGYAVTPEEVRRNAHIFATIA